MQQHIHTAVLETSDTKCTVPSVQRGEYKTFYFALSTFKTRCVVPLLDINSAMFTLGDDEKTDNASDDNSRDLLVIQLSYNYSDVHPDWWETLDLHVFVSSCFETLKN